MDEGREKKWNFCGFRRLMWLVRKCVKNWEAFIIFFVRFKKTMLRNIIKLKKTTFCKFYGKQLFISRFWKNTRSIVYFMEKPLIWFPLFQTATTMIDLEKFSINQGNRTVSLRIRDFFLWLSWWIFIFSVIVSFSFDWERYQFKFLS